ncbi:hypothetical protein SAMN05444358_10764 [Ruegeria halocynthiae]|uniref:DUF333 domain-containing protein n=1 Tax=Ruegeria halocynthiae TaxID=985054 RepID=A0A1H3CN03_9RHOB|nr:DUF333 domain-containing protein [Ruegeria halocynthiae]SDX55258.1 hypothetical protein SAMN05444358_10764 [Ruegeria halocynthiae]
MTNQLLKFPGPLFALAMALWVSLPTASTANPGLANPAATYCITQGGLYGIRDGADGQSGVCQLPDGTKIDAWTYFREHDADQNNNKTTGLANPAAVYCGSIGGDYDLKTSRCTFSDGASADAWELYRKAHGGNHQLVNPAAAYCLEIGGSYKIKDTGSGQVGICTKPDGTSQDAWALFRADHPE